MGRESAIDRMSGPEREKELLRTFAIPSKRHRYIELLGSRKVREKVRLSLDHFGDLDPGRCNKVPPQDQTPARIATLLRALGAPATCYILSSNSNLDGREMELAAALEEIVGYGSGSFVCCIPGRLAYFEGEAQGARYLW
jgi:hypothetical protein